MYCLGDQQSWGNFLINEKEKSILNRSFSLNLWCIERNIRLSVIYPCYSMAYVSQKINESDTFTIDRTDSNKSDQKQKFLVVILSFCKYWKDQDERK